MRCLVVYYSVSGMTEAAAKIVARALGADTLRLETLRRPFKKGLGLYFAGSFQALSGFRPKLRPFGTDPAPYDLIVVGTPVWAGRCAPAVGSFLASGTIDGKKTALFATCLDDGTGAIRQMTNALAKRADVISTAGFRSGNPDAMAEAAERWSIALADMMRSASARSNGMVPLD